MKPLDKNKKYDLSQLNDEQLKAVLYWLKENDKDWEWTTFSDFKRNARELELVYKENLTWHLGDRLENTKNALDLFDEEPKYFIDELKKYELKWCEKRKCYFSENNQKDTSVHDDMLSLIEKGKQQGLKIKISFEKM